ncbi:MAG: hypothetical protein ABJE66_37745, partial [Deltaproteobacteria bacterium]
MPAKDRNKRRATWNAWYQRTKHLRTDTKRRSSVKLARGQHYLPGSRSSSARCDVGTARKTIPH